MSAQLLKEQSCTGMPGHAGTRETDGPEVRPAVSSSVAPTPYSVKALIVATRWSDDTPATMRIVHLHADLGQHEPDGAYFWPLHFERSPKCPGPRQRKRWRGSRSTSAASCLLSAR